MNEYFVYILECNDKSFYIGVTNNIEKRVNEHNQGIDLNSYTYNKRPVKLVYLEETSDIIKAIEREKQLKGWSKEKKKKLIENDFKSISKLSQNSKIKRLRQAQSDNYSQAEKHYTGLYITENVGNNALSYNERINLKSSAKLYIPGLINGTLEDIRLGKEIVFEDFDENGNLISASGLEKFVRTDFNGIPVTIFDNHNHALYFWYEALSQKIISKNATLLHIDQHSDMKPNSNDINIEHENDLDYIFEFTNYRTNVGNYILPAQKSGMVGKIVQLRTQYSLENIDSTLSDIQQDSTILNIDLDFWAPEMDLIDEKLKYDTTKQLMLKADIITICTSPFFIEQKLALDVLKKLFE